MPLTPQCCLTCKQPIYYGEGRGSKASGPAWRHTESGAKVCPGTFQARPFFPNICGQLVGQWGRCDLAPGHMGACKDVQGTLEPEEPEEPELCSYADEECKCTLLYGHEGPHKCRHGITYEPV